MAGRPALLPGKKGGIKVRKRITSLLAVALLACLGGCGAERVSSGVPVVALAMEGPPLAIVGEYNGMSIEGSMDRTCMSGVGSMTVRGEDAQGREFLCTAKVDAPPTEKGRVRGAFQCTGERVLAFSLRNLGPDQGLGVAREPGNAAMMVFFYHVSREEAARRLPAVRNDIAKIQQRQAGQKGTPIPATAAE